MISQKKVFVAAIIVAFVASMGCGCIDSKPDSQTARKVSDEFVENELNNLLIKKMDDSRFLSYSPEAQIIKRLAAGEIKKIKWRRNSCYGLGIYEGKRIECSHTGVLTYFGQSIIFLVYIHVDKDFFHGHRVKSAYLKYIKISGVKIEPNDPYVYYRS